MERYDCGLINDYGGGDVQWWQDYIRAEIERCNDHWEAQLKEKDEEIQGLREGRENQELYSDEKEEQARLREIDCANLMAENNELRKALEEILDVTTTAFKNVPSGVGYNCHMIATEALSEEGDDG